MGSSPFTATNLPDALAAFFLAEAPIQPGQRLLVAFSGGPDSTALLAGLKEVAVRGFEVHAAHVDHGLDPDSPRRATAARRISRRLGVPFHSLTPQERPRADESPEAAARRIRYSALEALRRRLGARYLVTAHHRDDQAETVLLRLAFGSTLAGLGGIRPVHGRVVRPLLELSRRKLHEAALERGLAFVEDPTNLDLRRPRNLLRHRLLPVLEEESSGAGEGRLRKRLASLASAADRARRAWSRRLFEHLDPRPVDGGWGFPLAAVRNLPEEVQKISLDLLHRLAGHPYPPTAAACRELQRQLRQNGRIGVDCGAHLRWERRGKLLVVAPHATPTPFFSYTLQVPGEVRVAELGMSFRLSETPLPAPEGFGVVHRALFGHGLEAGDAVTIRNRRPGDCMNLPGERHPRRLKQVLTDRQVPLRRRDRLPLACVKGVIVWIPGFGVDARAHPGPSGPTWFAEISFDEQ